MSEDPLKVFKVKKDASIMVAARAVRDGEASALFSPGNTGATLLATTMIDGRLKGVLRPALAIVIPSLESKKGVVVLDVGANPECKPIHLIQFAIMGEVYSKEVFSNPKPRIGLLSIGEEEEKGTELIQKTHKLMKKIPFNFVGNIESNDIFNNKVDVVVCDGFVGNILLKSVEGVASTFLKLIKSEIDKSIIYKAAGMILSHIFKLLKKKMDSGEHGGAPLLGLNCVTIIGHGNSTTHAVKNGIKTTVDFLSHKINDKIIDNLKNYGYSKFHYAELKRRFTIWHN
jgi:glycerol-3-phosphate acyltransferase PlsX